MDPGRGIREPMLRAGVSSARELIEDSVFGFSASIPLSDGGVDCTRAYAYFTHDGLLWMNATLETLLTVPVADSIGFAFNGFGMGAGLLLALNSPRHDVQRPSLREPSPGL